MGYRGLPACASVLTVGTVVAIAASKAGDISQDLKTGALVGATPAKQQLGQLIGASVACWAVAGTVLLLGQVYTFGSREIPAPPSADTRAFMLLTEVYRHGRWAPRASCRFTHPGACATVASPNSMSRQSASPDAKTAMDSR